MNCERHGWFYCPECYGDAKHRNLEGATTEPTVTEAPIPDAWYMGAHGDPIAMFHAKGCLVLMLHSDGSVTWKRREQQP